MIRKKNPQFDLRRTYRRTCIISCCITLVLHVGAALLFPTFRAEARSVKREVKIIEVQDIPETQQMKRPPPPPRPAVPIETESDDVPDDVTIETTDLAFDDSVIDLPPPPPPSEDAEKSDEEEILEFFMVEKKPDIIKRVSPTYPEIARKAGLEGTVFVQFTVTRTGTVRDVTVLRGPEIFRQAAIDAVAQFLLKPAMQNDKPVNVKMTIPIKFTLTGG